jgi:GT2 family glycosyltransferase
MEHIKKVAIIIPTFNRKAYLKKLLLQLAGQNNLLNIDLIPVVVIDGSTDGTSIMLQREFKEVAVLKGPGNWWWTKSVNEGIRYALPAFSPDALLLLNDDSQIGPEYTDSIVNALHLAGDRSIIGSLSITDRVPHRVSFSGIKSINWYLLKKEIYHPGFEFLYKIPDKGLIPSYALNGRGTFLRTSLFKDLGYLNERVFPQYGSDDDLALRAWKKGYRVMISYTCKVIDRTVETSKGSALRGDKPSVFLKSFFSRHSVNYIPKQLSFFYFHGIKLLMPYYFAKFILGTSFAYFFKYKKLRHEL